MRVALSAPNHRKAAHSPTGTMKVYPYTKPAAPDSREKLYSNGISFFVARYCDIVPAMNRMKMTVVAIQKGPYRSGLPSRMSRKGERG